MGKLKLIIPIVLIVLGGVGYKFMFAKEEKPAPKPKVHGVLVPLSPEFVVNLRDGHFAKIALALEVSHKDPTIAAAAAEGGGHGPAEAPVLPQAPLLRAIITDHFTGADKAELVSREKRHHLLEEIQKEIEKKTDTKVDHVYITDMAVD